MKFSPLAIVSTLVVMPIATHLFLPLAGLKSLAGQLPSAPPLKAYGVDIYQTSASGVSSGGAMAVQMHVAHSSIMRGVGVVAGVAYDCAGSDLPLPARLARGIELCLVGSIGADAAFSIARTAVAAAVPGAIDPLSNLAAQKVWLFSGYNDGTVRREAMNAVAAYYENYVDRGNVFYQTDNPAPHALVTDDYGGTCLDVNDKYINNCNYAMGRHLLEHIYGPLKPPSSSSGLSGLILAFDQREFAAVNPKAVGLADTGYVYVPSACQTQTCRVHVVFHGCLQYAERVEVGDAIYAHGGYNTWADTNKLIVLYPQTVATEGGPLHPDVPANPKGCWDWWGYSPLVRNSEFAQKGGYQISAVMAMLDRLREGYVASGTSSDTFGPPQNVSAPDSTSTSVALIWEPNNAAAGFNIYQSLSSAGPYAQRNIVPVKGSSFVDRQLSPQTTYYYQIAAVDASNRQSARTSPISKTTPSRPPACDPYFSDNVTHVNKARAYLAEPGKARALGSNQPMGPLSRDHFSHLIKDGPLPFYRVDYCP